MMKFKFKEGLLLGAATVAAQSEGGVSEKIPYLCVKDSNYKKR